MYDKTHLNTLQLSFILISQQRYYMGTIILILQIKKKILGVREIQMSCTSENNWPLGGSEIFISSLLDCCQHRLTLTLCAQWMQDLPPLNSAWVRRQRAHMLLSAWLSLQMRVCSEAESRTVRSGKYATGGMGNWSTNVSFGKGKAVEVCWLHSSIFALALKGDGLCH